MDYLELNNIDEGCLNLNKENLNGNAEKDLPIPNDFVEKNLIEEKYLNGVVSNENLLAPSSPAQSSLAPANSQHATAISPTNEPLQLCPQKTVRFSPPNSNEDNCAAIPSSEDKNENECSEASLEVQISASHLSVKTDGRSFKPGLLQNDGPQADWDFTDEEDNIETTQLLIAPKQGVALSENEEKDADDTQRITKFRKGMKILVLDLKHGKYYGAKILKCRGIRNGKNRSIFITYPHWSKKYDVAIFENEWESRIKPYNKAKDESCKNDETDESETDTERNGEESDTEKQEVTDEKIKNELENLDDDELTEGHMVLVWHANNDYYGARIKKIDEIDGEKVAHITFPGWEEKWDEKVSQNLWRSKFKKYNESLDKTLKVLGKSKKKEITDEYNQRKGENIPITEPKKGEMVLAEHSGFLYGAKISKVSVLATGNKQVKITYPGWNSSWNEKLNENEWKKRLFRYDRERDQAILDKQIRKRTKKEVTTTPRITPVRHCLKRRRLPPDSDTEPSTKPKIKLFAPEPQEQVVQPELFEPETQTDINARMQFYGIEQLFPFTPSTEMLIAYIKELKEENYKLSTREVAELTSKKYPELQIELKNGVKSFFYLFVQKLAYDIFGVNVNTMSNQ